VDKGRPEVTIVLDASMALAWHLERTNELEAGLARQALKSVTLYGALVPALWYPEVANGLLMAERRQATNEDKIAEFLIDLAQLSISIVPASSVAALSRVLALGQSSRLTAFDASYLELVQQTGAELATFDRQLAEAARAAGARVFGDPV
jgi:predicted nucleic acid-binding protein